MRNRVGDTGGNLCGDNHAADTDVGTYVCARCGRVVTSADTGVRVDQRTECWTRDEGNPHSAHSTKTATYMVEWLPDNKFRVPDLNNNYPYIGKDYIGTVTVTDTAYTFGGKKPTSGGSLDMWFDNREGVFSGLVVNRLNGIFEPPLEYVTKYNEKHTVTGYCKSAHVPGPPVYKKI